MKRFDYQEISRLLVVWMVCREKTEALCQRKKKTSLQIKDSLTTQPGTATPFVRNTRVHMEYTEKQSQSMQSSSTEYGPEYSS